MPAGAGHRVGRQSRPGLAFAAAVAELPLIVYVPEAAPRVKLDPMRAAGARLVPCRDYDEAEARAREHGARGEALYVSPYAHPDVIAGAGTAALEIVEQDPSVDAIVCPVGGGGRSAAPQSPPDPGFQVWGVETEAYTRSRKASPPACTSCRSR